MLDPHDIVDALRLAAGELVYTGEAVCSAPAYMPSPTADSVFGEALTGMRKSPFEVLWTMKHLGVEMVLCFPHWHCGDRHCGD